MESIDILSKDLMRHIALGLNLESIRAICRGSQKFNNAVCNSPAFWRLKIEKDFPHIEAPPGDSPRQFYTQLTNRNNIGISFVSINLITAPLFNNLSWHILADPVQFLEYPIYNGQINSIQVMTDPVLQVCVTQELSHPVTLRLDDANGGKVNLIVPANGSFPTFLEICHFVHQHYTAMNWNDPNASSFHRFRKVNQVYNLDLF